MDRTIIVPYRAEEKELSHILYNTIQGLTLIHPPSEDLRRCLSDEMFIKPNQHAFFHVMHYLFRIFDAQDFKKRFFWPITDKRSESNFRTSTVEYLKHINEKYQLNWSNIKSYLVVMPGGMKFISFLLDFVKFIVQELVKQKERQLNLENKNYRFQISEASLHKMCAKNEFFKCMASEFIDAVENVNTKYDTKSQKLMQHLDTLAQESELNRDILINDKFLKSFEDHNYQLFGQLYCDRSRKVVEMDHLISELKEAMENFYSKESGFKYDKQRVSQQLKRIRNHFSIDALVEDSLKTIVKDEGVNINTLILTFNVINETIQNELKTFNQKPCVGEFVYSRLLSLKKELQEMEAQITNFQKMLHENMKKSIIEFSQTPVRANNSSQKTKHAENTLLTKIVSTPPIKYEVPEGLGKPRLALVDPKSVNTSETTFNNFLVPPRAATIRQPNRNHSLMDQTITDLNNTMNRSKIIDPMQLLRSANKKDSSKYRTATPHQNISSLATKWKNRQAMLNENEVEEGADVKRILQTHIEPLPVNETSPQSLTKTASTTILHHSQFTPFSTSDRTRIARSQYQLDSSLISSEHSPVSFSSNYGKKLAAVKKVQHASLNFANISTSPSGRLEPLVTAEDLNIPKLKLNDFSLIDNNRGLNNSMVHEIPKLSVSSPVDNHEGDINFDNISKQTENIAVNIYYHDEDALFNISDSILKDVTL